MTKKIVYITPHCSTGGLPAYLHKKISKLINEYDIYVIEYNDIAPIYKVQKDLIKDLLQPNHYFSWEQGKNESKKSKELIDIIYSLSPDVVHLEEFPELFLPTPLSHHIYSENREYVVVESSHNSGFDPKSKKFLPDAFTFVSEIQEERFRHFRIPTTIVEYPIEENIRPDRTETLKELDLDPSFKHVINIGLFTPGKDQGEVFEIARKLKGNKIQFHFIGNQASNFQNYWKPLMDNKPDNCFVHGERSDVDKWYAACDLLLFPSKTELNPLTPREALGWDLPILMYNLPIYKDSYNKYDSIDYLTNSIDSNCQKVLTKLGFTTLSGRRKIPITKLVHLLTRPDDEREQASISSLEPLKNLGVDYIQHINEPETIYPVDTKPLSNHIIKKPGYFGAYNAFRNAIESEFTEDLDFFMICECDCVLTLSPEYFIEALIQVCKTIEDNDIYYFSFGATGERDITWSNNIKKLNDFSFQTDKIILAHCIIFPQKARKFLLERYRELSWDSPDLWLNECFTNKKKMGILNHPIAEQHEGVSLIDNEYKGTIQTFDLPDKDMRELLINVYEGSTIVHKDTLITPNTYNFNFIDGVFFEIKGEQQQSNNTYYKDIDGYFDFENIYSSMVREFPENSHFVEIGSFMGKSACYLATEIKNSSNKHITFDTIDNWEGNEELNKTSQETFLTNMKDAGISKYVNSISMDSIEASELYLDDSLDFVFLDGSHEYEDVLNDIKAWYPKVKDGGIIAGHDYSNDFKGVMEAVSEFFPKDEKLIKINKFSWLHRKNSDKSINISTNDEHTLEIIDTKTNKVIYGDTFGVNRYVQCSRKWYTDWLLRSTSNGKIEFEYKFNPRNQRVLISFESSSLGDNIAWIPYVEEFRKKHDCVVYCSTFWNQLYEKEYPDINFIKPGTSVPNIYALYRIGHFFPIDYNKNPNDVRTIPLQRAAADILGLEFEEIKPNVTIPDKESKVKDKYICIAMHSTAQCKYWNYPNGWQIIVDYFNEKGYKVVNIAREHSFMGNKPPKGVINRTGEKYHIKHRINELKHADLYIGVSSGLAWVSWAVGTPTILVSGVTKPYNEPQKGIYRLHNNECCNGCMNDINQVFDKSSWNWCPYNKFFECSAKITPEMVTEKASMVLNLVEQEYWNEPDNWKNKGDEWSKSFGSSKDLWKNNLYPLLSDHLEELCKNVLEIAPGQGRITQFLVPLAQRLDIVDMNKFCIDSCRERFKNTNTIHYHKNDGKSLSSIPNASKDLVISFDSFVHMNKEVIKNYLSEISKKLKDGGIGFIHHSSLQAGEEESFKNIGGRSNMTPPIFKELCKNNGLKVLNQQYITMNDDIIDCITIFKKYLSPSMAEPEVSPHSYGITSKLIILTTLYNSEKYISRCIKSIKGQSYENFHCYITDDLSTDDSLKEALKAIDGDSRFSLICNDDKTYQIGNYYNILHHREEIEDGDIAITVDGDDYLPDNDVFERINQEYSNGNVWLTYGSFNQIQEGKVIDGWAKEQVNLSNIRNEEWSTTHLRTFKVFLFREINRDDLLDTDDKFFKMSGDAAMMYPMVEMAGDKRVRYLSDINYTYNDSNPISEWRVDRPEQVRIDRYIRSLKPYKKLWKI